MDVVSILGGNKTVIRKYPIAATVSNAGIPFLQPAACGAGLAQATTTGADNMVGIGLDTATYATAQQTDNSDPQGVVNVIINPDAVIKAKLSGGATEDTALTQYDVTTASATGLAVTTGDDFSCPTFDEGVIWGYDGANAGHVRAITSVSSSAATVTVAFPFDTAVGDNFLVAPVFPFRNNTVTLTTNLYQVRADVAVATNTAALRCVEVDKPELLASKANAGTTNSFALFVSGNHVLGGVTH